MDKIKFNLFWSDFFKNEQDYYKNLSFEQFMDLKSILSGINNFITTEVTKKATRSIAAILKLSDSELSLLEDEVSSTSVNANGFDIVHEKFVCEVKVNIPVKKDKFGAAQRDAILKDFKGLLNNKSKSKITRDMNTFYKFICFYCKGENTNKAINHLVDKNNEKFENRIIFYKPEMKLTTENIYVILVGPKDFE